MAKKENKKARTCGECIHEFACAMWNVGNLRNTDATHCTNYETASEFVTYFVQPLESGSQDDGYLRKIKQVYNPALMEGKWDCEGSE